jgi:hypothetical protein
MAQTPLLRRRILPALFSALLPLAAHAQENAATLALAREYVALHRGTLPDLQQLATAAVGGGDDAEGLRLEAALRAELETAEPRYREAVAQILASGLDATALRRALADGSIRAVITASPNARRLSSDLNRLTVETVATVSERVLQREGEAGKARNRR